MKFIFFLSLFLSMSGFSVEYQRGLVIPKGYKKTQFVQMPKMRGDLPAEFDWRTKVTYFRDGAARPAYLTDFVSPGYSYTVCSAHRYEGIITQWNTHPDGMSGTTYIEGDIISNVRSWICLYPKAY